MRAAGAAVPVAGAPVATTATATAVASLESAAAVAAAEGAAEEKRKRIACERKACGKRGKSELLYLLSAAAAAILGSVALEARVARREVVRVARRTVPVAGPEARHIIYLGFFRAGGLVERFVWAARQQRVGAWEKNET